MPKPTPPSKTRRWTLFAAIGLAVLTIALIAAWKFTPLKEVADPRVIAAWLRGVSDEYWMSPLMAAVFVGASLVMFPNTVLCFAVIMALGPVLGTAYAFGGSMAAALAGYAIGRRGGKAVKKLHHDGVDRASAELRRGGFMQVLALRLLPVTPFSVTNLLCGAARVRLVPYVAATLVGISPYILIFAAFGRQARRLLTNPTPTDAAITVAILVLASFAVWQARSRVGRAK